ncbi:MAG: site-specific integrase, partial [Bacillota bacterium]|nr:site-specific integrase [Bacillota bacterium]
MTAGDERSIAQFAQVLRSRKKVSEGTVSVYLRDLQNFDEYLRGRNRTLGDVLASDIEQYLRALSESGKSSAVQARVATSLRQFYGYLAS